jgi:hypothetical protein
MYQNRSHVARSIHIDHVCISLIDIKSNRFSSDGCFFKGKKSNRRPTKSRIFSNRKPVQFQWHPKGTGTIIN